MAAEAKEVAAEAKEEEADEGGGRVRWSEAGLHLLTLEWRLSDAGSDNCVSH